MKILHIIASLDPAHGGPVHGLQNYIPEFYSRGLRNEILCLDDPSAPFFKNSKFPIVHAVGPSTRPWCYTSKLIPWLKEKILNFDVILIHGLWLYHGYAVNKVVKEFSNHKIKTPRIFVICHGMLDPYFQTAPERRWKAIRNYIYWNLIESKVIKNANGVLFTCEEELRLAKRTFTSYHPRTEKNISYGVAPPGAHSRSMDLAFAETCEKLKNHRFLLFLGRIHEKKGIEILIKAFEEIQKNSGENGNEPIALLIAGPGFESLYGREIKDLVNRSEARDQIFLSDMLTGPAKWGAFYNCEAFVLPSHQENFGIAVVEALACSKPVLISNKVNIWREIEKAESGLVENDTVEGTIKLLQNWLNLPADQKDKMQKNARRIFDSNFAIGPAVTRLMSNISA